jgi:leucyl/phenylalanyl-tRNA---protein transferase
MHESGLVEPVSRVIRAVRHRGLPVRVTVRITPDGVLRGAAAGRFPYPRAGGFPLVPWYLPKERIVLRAERAHIGKSLRWRLRREEWTTSVNQAFDEVVRRCAARPSTWMTPPIQETYRELHRRGHAYSLDVWAPDGRLIGGTFGVQTGGMFSVESLFHSETDASKVALIDLASRVRAAGGAGLDCEYPTGYISALGAEVLDRSAFRQLLRAARARAPHLPPERLPVARLVDPSSPDAVDTPPGSRGVGAPAGVPVESSRHG